MTKDERKLENKKKKVLLNHQVRSASRKAIDDKWKEILAYCDDHGYEYPKKGIFVSDVIDASLLIAIKPEDYVKNYQ